MRISVTLNVPNKILNPQNVIREIARVQRSQTAPDVRRLFQRTVVGWKNPPGFPNIQKIERDSIGITTSAIGTIRSSHGLTATQQYALVNVGANQHPIPTPGTTAVGGWLRFQRGYSSSTRPRVLSSRAYIRSGVFRRARSVDHPGFDPREFDAEIADQYTPTFTADMQDAINRGANMP